MGITDPEVFALYQGLTVDSSASIEVSSALGVMGYSGFPGLQATALSQYEDVAEPYIFHFPDGLASIARLLVRDMIPRVAAGTTMDDIVLAKFDYSNLDEEDSNVRLRLNSMVVRAEHEGSPEDSKQVAVTYVKDGEVYRVRGKHCVMAGYNAMIQVTDCLYERITQELAGVEETGHRILRISGSVLRSFDARLSSQYGWLHVFGESG
jgi:spermidine dehydrogenase